MQVMCEVSEKGLNTKNSTISRLKLLFFMETKLSTLFWKLKGAKR